MLVADWFFIAVVVNGIIAITASAAAWIYAGKLQKGTRRNAIRFTAVSLGSTSAAVLFLLIVGSIGDSHSAPIYSPSGTMAARIENDYEGGTGGRTIVELFWAHGLRKQIVFLGAWKSVHPSGVQWKTDAQLAIHYDAGDGMGIVQCTPAAMAQVTCLPW